MQNAREQGDGRQAFGKAVRRLRRQNELSQEALGAATGLHRNYVGQLERSEISPTLPTILRLAAALEVKPSELFALAEQLGLLGTAPPEGDA